MRINAMKDPFAQHNIYQLPLDEEFGRKDVFFVYAPVAGNMMIASHEECEQLKRLILHPEEADEDMSFILDSLLVGTPASERDSRVRHVDDFLLMYILPNYICNFSCSYCFSAKGRSKQALKQEHLKAALDFFIDSNRTESDRLAITYLGGGEPTISWDVLRYGLEYGDELASKHSIHLMTTLVTNGSIVDEEMVEVFRRYGVRVRVSFEILEEIQNKQRGQYENVCRGVDLLCQGGVETMVRSMITPDNVNLMPLMIERLHERFPQVHIALFDPITSSETFSDPAFTAKFYDDYFNSFLKARQVAAGYGIKLTCAPLRNLDMVVERYCTGEFCLTPEGTITLCHQVSSPREKGYDKCVYARIDDENTLHIDHEKFDSLIQQDTIYTQPRCKDCFIKWNCGGGCMMQNNQYSAEIRDVICDFTRRFSKFLLIERLADDYSKSGESLADIIKNYPC